MMREMERRVYSRSYINCKHMRAQNQGRAIFNGQKLSRSRPVPSWSGYTLIAMTAHIELVTLPRRRNLLSHSHVYSHSEETILVPLRSTRSALVSRSPSPEHAETCHTKVHSTCSRRAFNYLGQYGVKEISKLE